MGSHFDPGPRPGIGAIETAEQRFAHLSELPNLGIGELVENPPTNFMDVTGSGRGERRPTRSSEYRVLPASVVGAALPLNQIATLETRDGMGHAALGNAEGLSEFAHSHALIRGFGECNEDCVIGNRQVAFLQELSVKCRVDEHRGDDKGSPGGLLFGRQPLGFHRESVSNPAGLLSRS